MMKHIQLFLKLACLSIICTMFSGVVFALDSDEARVSVAWSTESPYPSGTATITVTFISNSSKELSIYYFGLNFDWMESDRFFGFNLSDAPVTVQPYDSTTFSPLTIQIPENTTVGSHSYSIGIAGLENEFTDFNWNSTTLTLVVQNVRQNEYNELVAQVSSNIDDAVNADYQSSSAQSLLDQAEYAYSQALTYAVGQNWDDAISELHNASLYLEQAETQEEEYIETENKQDSLLLIVVAVVAVVVVAVLITFLIMRKRTED
jgi:hypothetical protein